MEENTTTRGSSKSSSSRHLSETNYKKKYQFFGQTQQQQIQFDYHRQQQQQQQQQLLLQQQHHYHHHQLQHQQQHQQRATNGELKKTRRIRQKQKLETIKTKTKLNNNLKLLKLVVKDLSDDKNYLNQVLVTNNCRLSNHIKKEQLLNNYKTIQNNKRAVNFDKVLFKQYQCKPLRIYLRRIDKLMKMRTDQTTISLNAMSTDTTTRHKSTSSSKKRTHETFKKPTTESLLIPIPPKKKQRSSLPVFPGDDNQSLLVPIVPKKKSSSSYSSSDSLLIPIPPKKSSKPSSKSLLVPISSKKSSSESLLIPITHKKVTKQSSSKSVSVSSSSKKSSSSSKHSSDSKSNVQKRSHSSSSSSSSSSNDKNKKHTSSSSHSSSSRRHSDRHRHSSSSSSSASSSSHRITRSTRSQDEKTESTAKEIKKDTFWSPFEYVEVKSIKAPSSLIEEVLPLPIPTKPPPPPPPPPQIPIVVPQITTTPAVHHIPVLINNVGVEIIPATIIPAIEPSEPAKVNTSASTSSAKRKIKYPTNRDIKRVRFCDTITVLNTKKRKKSAANNRDDTNKTSRERKLRTPKKINYADDNASFLDELLETDFSSATLPPPPPLPAAAAVTEVPQHNDEEEEEEEVPANKEIVKKPASTIIESIDKALQDCAVSSSSNSSSPAPIPKLKLKLKFNNNKKKLKKSSENKKSQKVKLKKNDNKSIEQLKEPLPKLKIANINGEKKLIVKTTTSTPTSTPEPKKVKKIKEPKEPVIKIPKKRGPKPKLKPPLVNNVVNSKAPVTADKKFDKLFEKPAAALTPLPKPISPQPPPPAPPPPPPVRKEPKVVSAETVAEFFAKNIKKLSELNKNCNWGGIYEQAAYHFFDTTVTYYRHYLFTFWKNNTANVQKLLVSKLRPDQLDININVDNLFDSVVPPVEDNTNVKKVQVQKTKAEKIAAAPLPAPPSSSSSSSATVALAVSPVVAATTTTTTTTAPQIQKPIEKTKIEDESRVNSPKFQNSPLNLAGGGSVEKEVLQVPEVNKYSSLTNFYNNAQSLLSDPPSTTTTAAATTTKDSIIVPQYTKTSTTSKEQKLDTGLKFVVTNVEHIQQKSNYLVNYPRNQQISYESRTPAAPVEHPLYSIPLSTSSEPERNYFNYITSTPAQGNQIKTSDTKKANFYYDLSKSYVATTTTPSTITTPIKDKVEQVSTPTTSASTDRPSLLHTEFQQNPYLLNNYYTSSYLRTLENSLLGTGNLLLPPVGTSTGTSDLFSTDEIQQTYQQTQYDNYLINSSDSTILLPNDVSTTMIANQDSTTLPSGGDSNYSPQLLTLTNSSEYWLEKQKEQPPTPTSTPKPSTPNPEKTHKPGRYDETAKHVFTLHLVHSKLFSEDLRFAKNYSVYLKEEIRAKYPYCHPLIGNTRLNKLGSAKVYIHCMDKDCLRFNCTLQSNAIDAVGLTPVEIKVYGELNPAKQKSQTYTSNNL